MSCDFRQYTNIVIYTQEDINMKEWVINRRRVSVMQFGSRQTVDKETVHPYMSQTARANKYMRYNALYFRAVLDHRNID